MQVSAWNDGGTTFGLRVGAPNRDRFFKREWDEIHLEIEGVTHRLPITESFWKKCPEIRSPVIRDWLKERRALEWPTRKPPRMEMVHLGGNRFRLLS